MDLLITEDSGFDENSSPNVSQKSSKRKRNSKPHVKTKRQKKQHNSANNPDEIESQTGEIYTNYEYLLSDKDLDALIKVPDTSFCGSGDSCVQQPNAVLSVVDGDSCLETCNEVVFHENTGHFNENINHEQEIMLNNGPDDQSDSILDMTDAVVLAENNYNSESNSEEIVINNDAIHEILAESQSNEGIEVILETQKKAKKREVKAKIVNKNVSRQHLSTDEKLAIIKMMENNEEIKDISKKTGVKEGQLYKLRRNRAIVLKNSENLTDKQKKTIKHNKKCSHPEVERALYLWVVQQRTKHVPLTSIIVRQQATNFHNELCTLTDCKFSSSSGWFNRFKDRYSLRVKRIHGEKLSADLSQLHNFKQKLQDIIVSKRLSLDEIYNADESAMYYKLMPNRTITLANEKKVSGRKAQRERFTFMPCVNVTGTHKIDLQIIGKSKSPRCFKNAFPLKCKYFHSKNAWQTKKLFNDWFHNVFIPEVRKYAKENNKSEAKALLILDNCSAHNELTSLQSDDGLITAIFLPPNVTSVAQPLDQNVIVCVKNNYRKLFLQNILAYDSIDAALKHFSLLKAILFLIEAWDKVPPLTIFKSWSKLLSDMDLYKNHELYKASDTTPNDDMTELISYAKKIMKKNNTGVTVGEETIIDWMKECDDVESEETFTDSQIIQFIKGGNSNDNDDELQNDDGSDTDNDDNSFEPVQNSLDVEDNIPSSDLVDNEDLQTKHALNRRILENIHFLISVLSRNDIDKLIFLRNWKTEILNELSE